MRIEISSKNNETVKNVRKLLNSAKFRNSEKKFVIEGTRLCEEAVKSNVEVTQIFYTQKCLQKFSDLIGKITQKNNAHEFLVSEAVMQSMSDTEGPQGIICVCNFVDKFVNMSKIKACSNIILLENLQNPSNLGSILRSLNAFNIDFVGISFDSCDIYNPKALRGSMGAIFKLNIMKINDFSEFISLLKSENVTVCATVPDENAENITALNDLGKKAVILGNEGNGISNETLDLCDKKMTIPMNPLCESLSVAVAAGIVAWEMSGKGK